MKIFLSYAREDLERVSALSEKLVTDGFHPWLDVKMLLPGQDWDLEINRAIKTSDVIILCLTSRSVQKEGYVQREMKKAIDLAQEKHRDNIFIIPARLDECTVPEDVSRWQYVDLFADDGYQRLLKALAHRANQLSKTVIEKQPGRQNPGQNELVKIHTIAQELYKQAELALQENQNTLTPLLQGLELPEIALQKMIGVFNRQRSRGLFAKHTAYLDEYLQSLDANNVELKTIIQDLLQTARDLTDMFYSLGNDAKRATKKSALIHLMSLDDKNRNESLMFITNYLEGIRSRVESLAKTVGKLSAMIKE